MEGAAFLGYRLVSRTTEAVVLELGGRLWTYDVLAVLEFNSDRFGGRGRAGPRRGAFQGGRPPRLPAAGGIRAASEGAPWS